MALRSFRTHKLVVQPFFADINEKFHRLGRHDRSLNNHQDGDDTFETLQYLIDKEIIDRYLAQLHPKFKGNIYVLNGLWLENLSEIIDNGAQ